MRASIFATSLACAFMLTACGEAPAEPETVKVALDQPARKTAPNQTGTPTKSVDAGAAAASATDYGATPMEDRVAVIGLLNKRNNVSQDISLKPGESREIGPVIIRLSACERTPPWELPQETGAFVQVDIRGRGQQQHRRVFSGWLFRESPSLNVVEHPIYDVWIKDCTMRFPGEEGSAAADRPAEKAVSGKPAPSASATPAPTAAPAPAPAPATEPAA